MPIKATFKIISWEEEPFDEPEDGPKLTRAHIRKSFHGDLSGTGNLMYIMTYLDSGVASFTGFEKVVGGLGGRTGRFVLRHTGFSTEKRPRRSTRWFQSRVSYQG